MFFLNKEKKLIYSFYGFCSKCATNSTLELIKIDYFLSIKKFKFRLYSQISVVCSNCLYEILIPEYTAKKIFKKGIRANDLLVLLKSNILRNKFIVLFASLWWVFLIVFSLNLIFLVYNYFSFIVLFDQTQFADSNDIKANSLGKVFRVKVKADLTQAFSLDLIEWENSYIPKLISQEIYFPVFLENENNTFFIFRGNNSYANQINNIINNSANLESLSYYDLEIIGRAVEVNLIRNEELKNFFLETYPNSRMLEPPYVLIDGSKVISVQDFIFTHYLYFTITFGLCFFSMMLDFYIEKLISKYKNNIKFN